MASNNKQTASFIVRFNQSIYEQARKANVQWRGKISHVQDGDAMGFTDMSEAMSFIRDKLTKLTIDATADKSEEEQEGILEKSLDIWNKVKATGPKLLIETLKDPKKQVSQIQDQIQYQIFQVSSKISSKVELDQWRAASKSDFKSIKDQISALNVTVAALTEKIDQIAK